MSHVIERPAPRVEPAELEVRQVRTPDEFAAVVELRRRVFGLEQGIGGSRFDDPEDARSIHALAVVPEGAVGTGRLTLNANPDGEAQVTWVATLPEYRGRGIGTAVMRFLLERADEAGASMVALNAQTHALNFYRQLGFVAFGSRFEAFGIEHQLMVRPAPRW